MLHFNGPYHISQLSNQPISGQAGIYMWGFAYQFNGATCVGPMDLLKGSRPTMGDFEDPSKSGIKFIPYYVGQTNDIGNRISKHSKIRTGDASKFIRFSMGYMNDFYKGNGFPVSNGSDSRTDDVLRFLTYNPGSLNYYNNERVLRAIYHANPPSVGISPIGKGNHWPINQQVIGKYPLDDTLDKIINTFNNFFFCYATLPDGVNITDAENSAFWALKGFTISKITTAVPTTSINISGYWSNLFRSPSPTPCKISTPVIFPGY